MKTTPKLIYASELLNLLIPERELETINGICFRLESPGQLTAMAVLKTDNNTGFRAELHTDKINLLDFIANHTINDLRKLNGMKGSDLWYYFVKGQAHIGIQSFELDDAEICFRIIDEMTMVYSRDLHFFDEVYEPLTMLEHFEEYLQRNSRMIGFAMERRWKW